MIGEIRDKETAEVAMKAAMTGHVVFSTLHTNSAPETIGRLRDIGIEPYLMAATVTAVMAQRLLRLLCPDCKQPYNPPAIVMKNLFADRNTETSGTLYRPKGCSNCYGSGYRGRRGIFELMTMSDELRVLIHTGRPVEEIKKMAISQGTRTLRESGLDLVFRGLTTVEEVFRNTVE
jgi:type II secretory ATPase GspE/PulE/Tfp pilus assembly ATPase PilB-like protein